MMQYNPTLFKNRTDAGQKLGQQLQGLQLEEPVVLAVPAGGVPGKRPHQSDPNTFQVHRVSPAGGKPFRLSQGFCGEIQAGRLACQTDRLSTSRSRTAADSHGSSAGGYAVLDFGGEPGQFCGN